MHGGMETTQLLHLPFCPLKCPLCLHNRSAIGSPSVFLFTLTPSITSKYCWTFVAYLSVFLYLSVSITSLPLLLKIRNMIA